MGSEWIVTKDDELPSEIYEAQALEALKENELAKGLIYAVLSVGAVVREAADDLELALSALGMTRRNKNVRSPQAQ